MRRRPLIGTLPALALAPAAARAQSPAASARAGERVLRIAFPTPETVLDPVQTNSDQNTTYVLAQIFEAPLTYDYLARPVRLVPATAAALPDVSADGREFTVRLEPGIFFADDPAFGGRPRELTAHDYVYAIKRFYDPRFNSSDLYIYESLKLPGLTELRNAAVNAKKPFDYDTDVDGVRALDRYTLRIRLGEADPRFVYNLAHPVYAGAVAREVCERYGDDIGAHPVGTGGYRLGAWRRGSRIELVRNPRHRRVEYDGTPADDPVAQRIAADLKGRPLPLADRIVCHVIEEQQPRWLAFLEGAFDWIEVPGPFRQLAAPRGRIAPWLAKRGITLQAVLAPDMTMNFFFMQHPLVGGYTPEKVALRRAIALAFDSDAFVHHVRGGYGIRAQSTVPPFTSGYDPAYKSEMSDHDPARARALLDLYGYVDRNGDGWREQPDGQPLELAIASQSSLLDRRQNELWKRALDAVGLRVRFDISTWPELLKKSRAGTLMMWGYSWSAGSPDGGFFLGLAYGPNAGEANDPRFQLAAFDRLYERQRALPDGPARDAVFREAKNMLVAYMPFKVHSHSVQPFLLQPWTRNFWRHPFMRDFWRFIDVGPRPE